MARRGASQACCRQHCRIAPFLLANRWANYLAASSFLFSNVNALHLASPFSPAPKAPHPYSFGVPRDIPHVSSGCCRTRCITCLQRLTLWAGSLKAWLKASTHTSQPSRHSRQPHPSRPPHPSKLSRHSRQPHLSRHSRHSNPSRPSRQPHPSRLSPAACLPHQLNASQACHLPQSRMMSRQPTHRLQQAAQQVATKALLLKAGGLFSFPLLSLPGQGLVLASLCSPTFPALLLLWQLRCCPGSKRHASGSVQLL